MRIRVLLPFLACLSAGALAQQIPSAPSTPRITFARDAVLATGITTGGEVAWFAVGHAHEDDALHVISRHAMAVDDDRDGAVRFEVGRAVPQHSVWIAVDVTTGELAVASPEGHELRRLPLPAQAIHPGAGGASDLLEDTHRLLQVLVVRPRTGAWGGEVGDGGASDSDGRGDGRLLLSLDELTPFDGSPELRPAILKPGDVLAAIAIDSLETYAVKVPGGAPQG
jgi:hypothetical protein